LQIYLLRHVNMNLNESGKCDQYFTFDIKIVYQIFVHTIFDCHNLFNDKLS
jgi:hypothetical protein